LPDGSVKSISKKYDIPEPTVKKYIEFGRGVDAIGEISPVAKEKILSGESGMTKTAVREMRNASPNRVKEVAKKIESGEVVHVEDDESGTKVCRCCGVEKPYSDYHKCGSGRKNHCKLCYSSNRLADVKGNRYSSTPEDDKLIRERGEDIIRSLLDTTPREYTVEHFIQENATITDQFNNRYV